MISYFKMQSIIIHSPLLFLFALATLLSAADYHVSNKGRDEADGLPIPSNGGRDLTGNIISENAPHDFGALQQSK